MSSSKKIELDDCNLGRDFALTEKIKASVIEEEVFEDLEIDQENEHDHYCDSGDGKQMSTEDDGQADTGRTFFGMRKSGKKKKGKGLNKVGKSKTGSKSQTMDDGHYVQMNEDATKQITEINDSIKTYGQDWKRSSSNQAEGSIFRSIDEYKNYLEEICYHDQRVIIDDVSQHDAPKKLYEEQQDEFIKHIQSKNLIDSYKLTFEHYIEQNKDPLILLKDKLRKESYEFLVKVIGIDEKIAMPDQANDNLDENLNFVIGSVDIEHYSIDEDHIYMIVKSVEEVSSESQCLSVNMIRIYQEKEIKIQDRQPNQQIKSSTIVGSEV